MLTGYALIIGFSSSEIISYLAKDRNEKKYSLFQIVNSTFAIVMGAIICTFLYGTFVNSFKRHKYHSYLAKDLIVLIT